MRLNKNLKFTKAQICTILESYYKEQEEFTSKVTIKENVCQVGFEMCPHTDVLEEMKIKGELRVHLEKDITQEELTIAVNYFLSEFNQEVESISFDKGISNQNIGYGLCESTITKAYFHGLIVNLKNNKKIGGK